MEQTANTVSTLKKLYEEFNQNQHIALRYARGLFSLSCKQNLEDAKNTIFKLEQLTEQFGENQEITSIYFKSLDILSCK